MWEATKSPVAKEALDRIAAIYVIETKAQFAPIAGESTAGTMMDLSPLAALTRKACTKGAVNSTTSTDGLRPCSRLFPRGIRRIPFDNRTSRRVKTRLDDGQP